MPPRPTRKRIGRGDQYTEEQGEAVCELVLQGKSVAEIGRRDGMPGPCGVLAWRDRHPAFARSFARAREACGDRYGHQVASIALEVLTGRLDPNVGRVAGDLLKWTASRMCGRDWGDRMEVDSNVVAIVEQGHTTAGLQAMIEEMLPEAEPGAAELGAEPGAQDGQLQLPPAAEP